MDINCINACIHQLNGKCTLNELPTLTSSTAHINGECPYYREIK